MGILDREEVSRRGLSGDAVAVLDALLSAPVAWQQPGLLTIRAKLDKAAVYCGLEALEALGWIDSFEDEDGLSVTLTPIAAFLLGVHLVEVGPDEIPRWAPIDAPVPPPPPAKGIFREYQALACVKSPALGPAEEAELAEEIGRAHPDPAEDEAPPEADPEASTLRRNRARSAKRFAAARDKARDKRRARFA